MHTVRIGAGQGFYGDTLSSALDMARLGNVEFICCDALSELTLAILQKDRQADPSAGYTRDLPAWCKQLLPLCRERNIKLITNAGGLNPSGAAAAIAPYASGMRVAIVRGDDVLDRLAASEGEHEAASRWEHQSTGQPLRLISPERRLFACAYLGASPIVQAFEQGADVVITGRVADSALFLAPAVWRLGWSWDDWDRLAAGTVMGHILECSGQASGGNFSGDWQAVPEPWRLGYAIGEISEDGGLIITRPVGTGGIVTSATVSEQLLYEVQNPFDYIAPDVRVDLGEVELIDEGPDRVRVRGVRGRPRPEQLKIVVGYRDGWMGESRLGYCWPQALAKARHAATMLRERFAAAALPLEDTWFEYQGWDSLYCADPLADESALHEVYLRVAVRTAERATAERAVREIPYLGLNGPPGVGGFGGITPPRELLGMWPTLIDRRLVEARVQVEVREAAAWRA